MSDDLSARCAAETLGEARAVKKEIRLLAGGGALLCGEIRAQRETLEVYSAIAEAWRDSRLIKGGWL